MEKERIQELELIVQSQSESILSKDKKIKELEESNRRLEKHLKSTLTDLFSRKTISVNYY